MRMLAAPLCIRLALLFSALFFSPLPPYLPSPSLLLSLSLLHLTPAPPPQMHHSLGNGWRRGCFERRGEEERVGSRSRTRAGRPGVGESIFGRI